MRSFEIELALGTGIKVDNIKLPWSSQCDGAVQAYQVLAQLGFIRRLPLPTKSISTSAEVVDAKTSVEESPVAEMLVIQGCTSAIFGRQREDDCANERHSVRRRIQLHACAHHVAHI